MPLPIGRRHLLLTVLTGLAILVLAAGSGYWFWFVLHTSPYRRQLPVKARFVREHRVRLSRHKTAVYLRAEVSPGQFAEYVRDLELYPYKEGAAVPEGGFWPPPDEDLEAPAWWDAPTGRDGTWLRRDRRSWIVARYAGGRLYLKHFWPVRVVEHEESDRAARQRQQEREEEERREAERRRRELILE